MKKLVVLIIIVASIFGMSACKSASPSDTVKAYYEALQVPDYEKALSYTDISDQEEIQKQLEKFKGFNMKVVSFEILSEKISEDGNSATVDVKQSVTSSFNETPEESTKTLNLVKVDGKWKLHE